MQDGWRKEASGTAAPENHPHAILIEHISWVSDGIGAANAILIELWGDGCSDGWMDGAAMDRREEADRVSREKNTDVGGFEYRVKIHLVCWIAYLIMEVSIFTKEIKSVKLAIIFHQDVHLPIRTNHTTMAT